MEIELLLIEASGTRDIAPVSYS